MKSYFLNPRVALYGSYPKKSRKHPARASRVHTPGCNHTRGGSRISSLPAFCRWRSDGGRSRNSPLFNRVASEHPATSRLRHSHRPCFDQVCRRAQARHTLVATQQNHDVKQPRSNRQSSQSQSRWVNQLAAFDAQFVDECAKRSLRSRRGERRHRTEAFRHLPQTTRHLFVRELLFDTLLIVGGDWFEIIPKTLD